MAPDQHDSHEGGLSVRDQIERYRTAFISVVVMVVIAAAVGGYILAHENLKLPGWVPVLGRNYFTLKAEFQTAQAVTPGPGSGGHDRGRQDRGNRERRTCTTASPSVTMKVTPEIRAHLPRRDAAAAPEDAAAGHHRRGQPGHAVGRAAAERRSDPAVADRAERQLRRIPLGARRRNARLPAGAAGRRRRRLQEQRQGALGDAQALRPDRARHPGDRPRSCEVRHANIARSIHNFRLLMEALGGKDKQLAQLVDASNAVFATFAKEDAELPEHAAPAAGRARTRPERASASWRPPPTCSGRRCTSCSPFAKLARRRRSEATTRARERDDAGHQERDPAVRARNPADDQPARRRPRKELGEAFPKLATQLLGAERILQRARLQPGQRARAASCSSSTGPTTTSTACVSSADAHGSLGRSLLYFNCEVAADPQRRRRSQPDGEPDRRPAEPARPRRRARPRACSRRARRRARAPKHAEGAGAPALLSGLGPRGSAAPLRRRSSAGGGSAEHAEARAHARQHARDHPVRAQLLRAAAVPVGVVRRPAAAEAEGLPDDGRLPAHRSRSPNSPTCASAASTSATSSR